MSPKVLVSSKIAPVLAAFLTQSGYELEYCLKVDRQWLLEHATEFAGMITSTQIRFDREMLTACAQLKWIGRMGSGMEQIDLAFAQERGIFCCSSPEGNANAVAEQALGMLLALKHRILKSHQELQSDIWQREENRGHEIMGLKAGIIGLGNNGLAFAQKLVAMGLEVYAFDIEQKEINTPGIKQVTELSEIQQKAQILSFHVPYNKDTHHYFDETFLNEMKHPFTLLNLSRGKIVSQKAVLSGIISEQINGAALDVWEREPISSMDPEDKAIADRLLEHQNFIGTSHIGGYTHDAIEKMSKTLALKLKNRI